MKKNYLKTMALALGLLGWSGMASAQNLLSEDFSSCVGTTPPTGWVDNDIAGSGFFWHFDNPGGEMLNAPITAPFAAFDSDNYGGNAGEESALESIAFDASGVTGSIFLSFDQYFDGDAGGEYHVEVYDGTSWVEVLSDISGGTTSNPDHQSVNITTALNGAVNAQVRFRWVGDYSYYWFVDNVSVDVVSCAPVSALTLAGISENTADISWTAGGSETSWNIEWGAPGYAVGTGAELGAATWPSTAYQIAGLTSNTSYDVYVQADCGGSGVATWVGPFTITTACTATNVPYTQDFESATIPGMPSCTSIENTGTGNDWETAAPADYGFNTQVLQYEYNSSNPANAWFYTQGINLTAGTNYQITYDYGDAEYTEKLKVAYGTSPNSTSMTNNIADHTTLSDGALHSNLVTFIAPTTGVYYFGFNAHSDADEFWLFVDNIVIDLAPACPAVMALTTTSVTPITADITWTAGGTETAWNIEWGTPGYAPGTGAEIGAASFPSNAYQITGLTANTHYDVYVQADCNVGGLATWFGPLDVFTGYCIPTNTYSTSYYISGVSTTAALQNLNNTGTGFGTNGYTDYSNTNTLIVYPGQQINFTFSHPSSTYGYVAWIDWNNNLAFSDVGDQILSSGYQSSPYTTSYTVPLTATPTTTRLRIRNAYISNPAPACGSIDYGEAEDYTIQIVAAPSCLPISGLTVDNFGLDSIQVSWTAGGLETSWNVQWGLPGFAPGTGAEIGAATSPTITYTVNGLNPSTTYDIYVQANCGSDSSYWALVTGTTLCAPISALPWTENFDAMTTVGYSIFPNCWIDESGYWSSDNSTNGQAYSAPNYVSIGDYDNDYLWTPEFNLVAGSTYEFAFRWIGNGNSGYDGSVYYSPSQSSIDAVQIGTNFISNSEISSDTDYKKEIYCFTPTTSGVYSFGIYVDASYSALSFDNFSLRIPSPNAGTNGATTVCQTGGLVDLNSVISISDTTGVWAFSPNPSALESDTLFNPAFIPSGTTNVYYVVSGCVSDSAIATINIYPKSNAGTDGTVSTCNYGPLNLFDGLTGNVDLGGQWYNPASQPIPGSMVNFNGEIAANYNYIYVVSNGVCPNDTSVIEIQLQDCAGVDEYELKGFVLYPNPSNGIINIQYSGKGEDVKLDVVDAKGAIVWSKQVLFNDNTTQTIDLSTVENGVYYINMTSKNGGSVMKVVKN